MTNAPYIVKILLYICPPVVLVWVAATSSFKLSNLVCVVRHFIGKRRHFHFADWIIYYHPFTGKMTLRFVKTSILSSEDGIGFSKEVAVENEETRTARMASELAANRPLFQQLAEIKDRKQEEYNENTKKMFAPPRALDEEDVEYFHELDDIKARAMDAREMREQRELSAFRAAQKVDRSIERTAPAPIAKPVISIPPVKQPTILPTVIGNPMKIRALTSHSQYLLPPQ